MKNVLSEVGRELFDQLTVRTFYVVDTEFSTGDDEEHHLISIAVIPVVGGRRTKTGEELHRVMNPGVPIDDFSASIHGFTDADVAKKRPFEFYAKVIVDRLREDEAVFVCHNTIDAHILRRELERLDERTANGETGLTVGLADLPDMPILDTQRLVTAIGYPGATKGAKVSLDKLCDLTGVTRTQKAHDARADARATADALIQLLRYTAEKCVYWNVEDLLDAGSGGTTDDPKGPAHIRGKRDERAPLPPEHIAKHVYPLTDPVKARSDEAERWLDMAYECAKLRCPYLRDEAKAAAAANGAILIRPLMDDLPHLTEPGKAGTLLGAVAELIANADSANPTLPPRRMTRWWKEAQPLVRRSVPCDRDKAKTMCPSCLDGDPCPRDVVYLPLVEAATLGGHATLDGRRIRHLLGSTHKNALSTWRTSHPDILAYALWRVAAYELENGHDEAAFTVLDQAIAMNLHTVEPRLTKLACGQLVDLGEADKAFLVAQAVIDQRTTDTAFDDLADWMLHTQHALHAQQPTPKKVATEPRRSRPPGHTNPRLYN